MLAIVATRIRDVLQRRIAIHSKPLGNLHDSLRSECAFGVNVRGFAFGASHVLWELGDDAHGVAELGLAAAVFAVDFADAHALEAAAKDLVELFAAGGYLDDLFAPGEDLDACDEGCRVRLMEDIWSKNGLNHPNGASAVVEETYETFLDGFLDLVDLGVTETLDLLKMLLHRAMD